MVRQPQPKKRSRRKARQEILGRYVRINASKQSVGIRADHPRGRPVRDVAETTITVFPDPDADVSPSDPPAIGAIIRMKPNMQVVVHYPIEEFNQLWILVAASQVRSAYVAFTSPFRCKSLVVTLDFSSALELEDSE
jgi:hypothetical protein